MAVTDERTGAAKRDSLSVSKLQTAADLCRKFEQLKRGRQSMDSQWKVNLAFYKGRQYVYWNRQANRMEELPTADGDKPRFRVRLVSNQILTGAQSLVAKYTKTKPVITATPSSADDHDVKAAQMSEMLFEHWWDDLQLDDKLEEALYWAIIAGQGWWHICWDKHAGKALKFTVDPQGNPITNDSLKTLYQQELRNVGVPIEAVEKTVYLGDVKVEAVSPFNVYIDPNAKTETDAKYAICIHNLDPDEIKARWKVDVTPDSVPATEDTTLPVGYHIDNSEKTTKRVYCGYFLPTPSLPKGRIVWWMDEPKQILEDKPWDYPDTCLPLVKFAGVRVPGQAYDEAIVTHALPLQKELNRTLSQIVEYKNLTIKPRVWAPVGSLRQRMTNEPGAVYEFTPIGGLKPEIEELPTMPPYVFDHLADINGRIKEVFSITEVTDGNLPPNLEAATAIDLLQEMASDRLAPQIKMYEKALGRAGQYLLGLAQRYYEEPRLLKIKGSSGSPQVQAFSRADITGGVDVRVESGSGLPRTRAGRQARIEKWVELGVMSPSQAWKYLDIADMRSLSAKFQADEDQASREHEKLLQGQPINVQAMQAAIQQVQTPDPILGIPVNPQTGAPWNSPEEVQAFVQDAAYEPLPYENSSAHLDVHATYMKSVEFEGLNPQQQQAFVTHYQKTAGKAQTEAPPNDNLKTTVQVKTTAGPTAASELLKSSGAKNITPEMMKEPPLETWVTNDVDKPDVDATPYQQQQQMDVEGAQAGQGLAHGEHAERRNQEKHEQSMKHADEAHKHKMAMDKKKAAQRPKPARKSG